MIVEIKSDLSHTFADMANYEKLSFFIHGYGKKCRVTIEVVEDV